MMIVTFRRAARFSSVALAAAALAAGCGSVAPPGQASGQLSVRLQPVLPSSGVQVVGGLLGVIGLQVIGDADCSHSECVAPAADSSLVSGGNLARFTAVPPGLYSRVAFSVSDVQLDGDAGQRRLHVHLPSGGPQALVDLRSAGGREVAPGSSAELVVAVDVGTWFSHGELDGAEHDDGGEVVVDDHHNTRVGDSIRGLLAGSFRLVE